MSARIEGLVETSSNLATVQLAGGELKIVTSQRSARVSRLREITARVHAVAALAGLACKDHSEYPPWPPAADGPLAAAGQRVYQRLFRKPVTIGAIHAGLECAVIGAKIPGMEMISLGPTIVDAHSPDELASATTLFTRPVTSRDDLVQALKAGAFRLDRDRPPLTMQEAACFSMAGIPLLSA